MWVLTKKEENQLLVFERNVLRSICGPKIENGVYKRRYSIKSLTVRMPKSRWADGVNSDNLEFNGFSSNFRRIF
jgi:hypothetical protein